MRKTALLVTLLALIASISVAEPGPSEPGCRLECEAGVCVMICN